MTRNAVGKKGKANGIKAKNTRSSSNLKTGRDYSYDKKYQDTPARIAYRVELNRKRRQLLKKGTVKKYDGKDVGHVKSHKKGGSLKSGYRIEHRSKNRARKEK